MQKFTISHSQYILRDNIILIECFFFVFLLRKIDQSIQIIDLERNWWPPLKTAGGMMRKVSLNHQVVYKD
jgi:hypothetical protein